MLPGCLLLLGALVLPADEKAGFRPLFNGKDLTGWVRVNNAPGTFFARGGEIVTTGVPTGYLRTDRMYENFILEFEWKHLPPRPGAVGNSGLFVWCDPLPALGTGYSRGIEVQVLVNLEYKDKKTGKVTATSHGDLFSIWGATCVPDRPHPRGAQRCLPSEYRAKGAGEWNHYRVEANDGVIKLAVNGKVVSGVSKCNPRKGYLALEAEGSECRFRNLKIKELPSTHPKPSEVCNQGKDFVTLFTGIDLAGWKGEKDYAQHWKALPGPNVLRHVGKGKGTLTTGREFDDFELQLDCKAPAGASAALHLRGNSREVVTLTGGKAGGWNRYLVRLRGQVLRVQVNGKWGEETVAEPAPRKGPLTLAADGEVEFMSLFVRPLK
jgi:hypothetical protein